MFEIKNVSKSYNVISLNVVVVVRRPQKILASNYM